DIDADHGDRGTGCLGHGVLLVLAPLASLSLAGQEHGRTIPLADLRRCAEPREVANVVIFLDRTAPARWLGRPDG
ncbi:hypothetical protein, partial [Bradyrhizobium diazoefficiens]